MTNNKKIQTPATDIQLTGKHLIEASAGTGKTWTLTGIVLRLLIEKRKAPENIVCTTFTRAAAAEMRERIHERLTDFYNLLNWLIRVSENSDYKEWLYPNIKTADSTKIDDEINRKSATKTSEKNAKEQRHATREIKLLETANNSSITSLLEDKVNMHLINFLCDSISQYPLAEAQRRTTTLITSLDKLFVSTLDSLAQKLLSEYSTETGFRKGMGICEDEQSIIDSIIHDELRKFQADTYYNNPALYDVLSKKGFTTVSDHKNAVNTALTFMSLPINTAEVKPFDFDAFNRLLSRFTHHDCSDITPYFDAEFRKKQKINAKAKLGTKIHEIPNIITAVAEHGVTFDSYINKEASAFLEALKSFVEECKGFSTKADKEPEIFNSLSTIQLLRRLIEYKDKLDCFITNTNNKLNCDIAIKVRQLLPLMLTERNETTFSLQMVKLKHALMGSGGKKLAKYIRHQYPVALIDESQDINGEQASVIRHIYLNNDSNNGFLLLVGDPKQAIYGFRGGDVANYNEVKKLFSPRNQHSLNINFRSSQALITGFNHWFGADNNNDDVKQPLNVNAENTLSNQNINKYSELGEGIYYQHITAMQQDSNLTWRLNNSIQPSLPVSVISIPYNKKNETLESELIASHISTILKSNSSLKTKPIKESDIAILGKTKMQLNIVDAALQKLGINTVKVADKSIFTTKISADLFAVFEAVMRPFHNSYVNRALTSCLYGVSLKDVQLLQGNEQNTNTQDAINDLEEIDIENKYAQFQQFLKKAAELWAGHGVLTAAQYLLSDNNPLASISVWENLASKQNAERYLIDLRQILDILAQNTNTFTEYETINWLGNHINQATDADWAIQQPIPTQTGVQLMTIHKSKGLEFPIVYVLGMDKAINEVKKPYNLYLTNNLNETNVKETLNKRTLSTANDDSVINLVEKEAIAEFKRLIYVALTRASEQVFIPLKDAYNKGGINKKPSNLWLDCFEKNYALPERLEGYIGWQTYEDISACLKPQKQTKKENLNTKELDATLNTSIYEPDKNLQVISYPDYDEVIKRKRFIGWAKTSFTALAHNLSSSAANTNANSDDIENIIDKEDAIEEILINDKLSDEASINKKLVDYLNNQDGIEPSDSHIHQENIRFDFVRGANAGSFLHKIFEVLDFKDSTTWSDTIDKCVVEFDLPFTYGSSALQQQRLKLYGSNVEGNVINEQTHHALKLWINEVLESPLAASGVALKSINLKKRMPELGFSMRLSDGFSVSKISTIFAKYLGTNDERYVYLNSKNGQNIFRYLRGEIDLVYEHLGKYYVVDYKSNHLGNNIADYNQTNLSKAMSKAGYWLQAMIYQVALHRFLSLRIPDYMGNEHQYLGAVEYLFIRGCVPEHTAIAEPNHESLGKICWDIPIDMLKEMDAVFG